MIHLNGKGKHAAGKICANKGSYAITRNFARDFVTFM